MTAIITIPLIWLVSTISLFLTQKYLNWPDVESRELVAVVIIAAGFIPVALMILDFLSSRRAILSYKDVKINFRNINLSRPKTLYQDSPGNRLSCLGKQLSSIVLEIWLRAIL